MYRDRSRIGEILATKQYAGCFWSASNSLDLDLGSGYQGFSTFKIQSCKICLLYMCPNSINFLKNQDWK